jgi:hypothetical protein
MAVIMLCCAYLMMANEVILKLLPDVNDGCSNELFAAPVLRFTSCVAHASSASRLHSCKPSAQLLQADCVSCMLLVVPF